MQSVNKTVLLGKLGRDPEVSHTPNGHAKCILNIATTKVWVDNGQKKESTQWHRVTVWRKQAENCAKFLSKGKSVYVEAELQTRSWEDKDGEKRYATDIVANNVIFLGGAPSNRSQSENKQSEPAEEEFQYSGNLDDLPF